MPKDRAKNQNKINTNSKHIALRAKDLGIGYVVKKQPKCIVDNINFELVKGELAAIVGINGIGKSTLLRTLGAVQPSLSGKVKIGNEALESYSNTALATILSVVLTEPVASKNLRVRELIALGRQPYTNWLGTMNNTDNDKVDKAIRMVGLEQIQFKKCYELSDGQVQKVMIARALAQDTDLMLLDEPTTHLDLFHKVHILKLLQRISHETGKTILYTTHEIELAIQLCDKMLILDGKGNSFGSPSELVEQKSFETLFPKDTIIFDAVTSSFRLKN
ncbi:MAG: ABC transporter ATP-binding protein [Flavobacteriaceae bacterium]